MRNAANTPFCPGVLFLFAFWLPNKIKEKMFSSFFSHSEHAPIHVLKIQLQSKVINYFYPAKSIKSPILVII